MAEADLWSVQSHGCSNAWCPCSFHIPQTSAFRSSYVQFGVSSSLISYFFCFMT